MFSRSSDDAAMQALLSPYGEIVEISIIKDKATGESKGLHTLPPPPSTPFNGL